MTTKQLLIAVAGTKIVTSDSQRTVLTLANTDTVNTIYISDDQGFAITGGFPIFPETFISLVRKQGDEPQKAWYGRTAVASILSIMEQFGSLIYVEPIPEVNPQEPFSPLDAPNMIPLRVQR